MKISRYTIGAVATIAKRRDCVFSLREFPGSNLDYETSHPD
jgi:hypothetical protein